MSSSSSSSNSSSSFSSSSSVCQSKRKLNAGDQELLSLVKKTKRRPRPQLVSSDESGSSDGSDSDANEGGGVGGGGGNISTTLSSSSSSSSSISYHRSSDFDPEQLYTDAADRKRLNGLTEFEREAELARRYEEVVRARQRQELFDHADRQSDKKQRLQREAFSDIRARRDRQRQRLITELGGEEEEEEESEREEKDSDDMDVSSASSDTSSSDDDESEESPVDSRTTSNKKLRVNSSSNSSSSISTSGLAVFDHEEDGGMSTSAAAAGGGGGGSSLSTAFSSSTLAGGGGGVIHRRKDDEGLGDLFVDQEEDQEVKRKKKKRDKALAEISLDLLQSVRVSTEKVLHMLDHPRASDFLKGCYVKIAATPTVPTTSPPESLVCSIASVEETEKPYCVTLGGGGGGGSGGGEKRMCKYKLIVRRGISTNWDKKVDLNELINKPILLQELEQWKSVLSGEIQKLGLEELPRKLKQKAQQLREFTFTDADVQMILERNQKNKSLPGNCGLGWRGGSRVKHMQTLNHEIETLKQNLASSSTSRGPNGASDRMRNKERLQELQKTLLDLKSEESAKLTNIRPTPTAHHHHHRQSSTSTAPQFHGSRQPHRQSVLRCGAGGGGGGLGGVSNNVGPHHHHFELAGRSPTLQKSSVLQRTLGGGSEGGDGNPFARRECRPTMMWDISTRETSVKGKSQTKNEQKNVSSSGGGVVSSSKGGVEGREGGGVGGKKGVKTKMMMKGGGTTDGIAGVKGKNCMKGIKIEEKGGGGGGGSWEGGEGKKGREEVPMIISAKRKEQKEFIEALIDMYKSTDIIQKLELNFDGLSRRLPYISLRRGSQNNLSSLEMNARQLENSITEEGGEEGKCLTLIEYVKSVNMMEQNIREVGDGNDGQDEEEEKNIWND